MKEKEPDGTLGFGKGPGINFEKFQERKIADLTECPAPHISGLCSLQALARSSEDPDVTVYGWDVNSVLERRLQMCRKNRVAWFLTRGSNKDGWSVYDADGLLSGFCEGSADDWARESDSVISVSKGQFTEEAREMVGDKNLSLVACYEEHAGASAADHSNFAVIKRRMIAEASEDDLRRVYMVESKRWPCRVLGVFANVSELSTERQNVYLDRFKWIHNGWPLVKEHHFETLAGRLATRRREYMHELLRTAGRGARLDNELQVSLIFEWELARPESKVRFARHLIEVLEEGLLFEKGALERFDLAYVQRHGREVLKDYRERLR